MTSPAETLRSAARLLRERAEAASRGPWKSWVEGRDHRGGDSVISTADIAGGSGDIYVNVHHGYHDKWEADQDYIASVHPLVGLALADWLVAAAALIDAEVFPEREPEMARYPLAVARLILGEAEGAQR